MRVCNCILQTIRVTVISPAASVDNPVLVSVNQLRGVTSWRIPFIDQELVCLCMYMCVVSFISMSVCVCVCIVCVCVCMCVLCVCACVYCVHVCVYILVYACLSVCILSVSSVVMGHHLYVTLQHILL